mmetsp:Transcript_55194/g.114335  ORF Transcript_55194/g.114335 Transcript_55194/m.114335 type:complete len:356 (-) Transcript_55194:1132-2199(-)
MVRVDHLLVRRVWIQTALHHGFRLVDGLSERSHLHLHVIAKVSRFLLQVAVGHGVQRRLELFELIHNCFISNLSWLGDFAAHVVALLQVFGARGYEAGLHHVDHGLCLDRETGDVVLQHDLLSSLGLFLGVDLQVVEQFLVLRRAPSHDGLRRGVQIRQASLGGFLPPLRRVAVAREDHVLVLLEHLCHRIPVAHATFDETGQAGHSGRHDGVANHDGQTAVLRGANCPKLEAVATEWERCCSIPVLHIGLDVHCLRASGLLVLLLSFVAQQVCATDDGIDELFEALTWIERDNGWRRFLGPKSVVVACSCYAAAHKLVVLGQAICQAGDASNKELSSFLRLSGIEKVKTSISSH